MSEAPVKKKNSVSSKQDKSQAGSTRGKKDKAEPLPEISVDGKVSQHPSQHASQELPPHAHETFMPAQPPARHCIHHNVPFQYFCETCEEPICQQCTVLGPHNTQLHRINRLNDAFKIRCAKIDESIKLNLLSKRE